MAKYKGPQKYSVTISETKSVAFNHKGEYETDDKAEIAVLDKLVPTWIKRVDDSKKEPEVVVAPEKSDDKKSEKTEQKRKSSAK